MQGLFAFAVSSNDLNGVRVKILDETPSDLNGVRVKILDETPSIQLLRENFYSDPND